MLRHLSPEWIAALDEAAQASSSLHEAAADLDLTVQQVVSDGDDAVTFANTLARSSGSPACMAGLESCSSNSTMRP